jgi:hypothetical protein
MEYYEAHALQLVLQQLVLQQLVLQQLVMQQLVHANNLQGNCTAD